MGWDPTAAGPSGLARCRKESASTIIVKKEDALIEDVSRSIAVASGYK